MYFLSDSVFMDWILFPFNQYSNLYSRFLEKDDAESTFIAPTGVANDPKVATEDDGDKSIGKLKIMNYWNCWKEWIFGTNFVLGETLQHCSSKLNVTLLIFF